MWNAYFSLNFPLVVAIGLKALEMHNKDPREAPHRHVPYLDDFVFAFRAGHFEFLLGDEGLEAVAEVEDGFLGGLLDGDLQVHEGVEGAGAVVALGAGGAGEQLALEDVGDDRVFSFERVLPPAFGLLMQRQFVEVQLLVLRLLSHAVQLG